MVLRLRCLGLVSFLAKISLFFVLIIPSAFAKDFAKKKVSLGGKTFVVEIAESPDQHERGLMFRTKMGEDEGMLFIFKNTETRFFWMKNTLIDLAIGYFDAEMKLIDIKEMKSGKGVPDAALPSYASAQPAKYALEMNAGWFDKNKIKLGSKLKIH